MSKETKRKWKEIKFLYKDIDDCRLNNYINKITAPEIDSQCSEKSKKHINAELFTFNLKIIRKNGKIYCVYSTNEGSLCHIKHLSITEDRNIFDKNQIKDSISSDLFMALDSFMVIAETKRIEEVCLTTFKNPLFFDNLLNSDEKQEDCGIYKKEINKK